MDPNESKANLILGLVKGTQPLNLSIQAEILQRIMYLKDEANYLMRPKTLVKLAIELFVKRELDKKVKDQLNDLFSD